MGLKSNDFPIDFSLKNHSNISPSLHSRGKELLTINSNKNSMKIAY